MSRAESPGLQAAARAMVRGVLADDDRALAREFLAERLQPDRHAVNVRKKRRPAFGGELYVAPAFPCRACGRDVGRPDPLCKWCLRKERRRPSRGKR